MCGIRHIFLLLMNVVFTLQLHDYTNYVVPGTEEEMPPSLRCSKHESLDDLIQHANRTKQTITVLEIYNCLPPANYKLTLESLNIEAIGIKKLTLYNVWKQLTAEHFAGMMMEELYLDFRDLERPGGYAPVVEFLEYRVGFLASLTTVKSLTLANVLLRPLPPTKVTKLTLIRGTSIGPIGECSSLQHLTLSNWNLTLIPDRWLSGCPLQTLAVENQPELKQDQVGRLLRGGVSKLQRLSIRNCYIEELDSELEGANLLEHLDLYNNQLHNLLVRTRLPSLTTLDISYNHIFGSALLATALEGQPRLRNLTVNHNPYMNPCDVEVYRVKAPDAFSALHEPLKGRMVSLPEVEHFSLQGSGTDSLCFNNMRLDKLRYLNLAGSHIDSLQLLGLPQANHSYILNVTGNNINSFPFEKPEYDRLTQQVTLVGLEPRSIECVCSEHSWLAAALRERRLVPAAVTCRDGRPPEQVPQHEWDCDKITCAGTCKCRRKLDSNETTAVCSDDLTHLTPDLINAMAGLETGVQITELDLTNNYIARLNTSEVEALFSDRRRKVFLSGNPILCDCNNERLIQALQTHKEQIPDYPSLLCAGQTSAVSGTWVGSLCAAPPPVWLTGALAAAGALVGLGALAAAAYCVYRREIKIYLYARGFCLCCVKEDELDSARKYDAFISFSHKDEAFVTEHFLPKIDKDYKICTHYRDWIAGEMITNQIVQSVENSRRTIIILSKNFLESIWGLLEFKTAHTSALSEGRVRVIIVVLDDVIDDLKCLDDELRNYLRTNTYIKWGDQWFWKKLFYALPHDPVRGSEMTDSGLELDEIGSQVTLDSGLASGFSKETISCEINSK